MQNVWVWKFFIVSMLHKNWLCACISLKKRRSSLWVTACVFASLFLGVCVLNANAHLFITRACKIVSAHKCRARFGVSTCVCMCVGAPSPQLPCSLIPLSYCVEVSLLSVLWCFYLCVIATVPLSQNTQLSVGTHSASFSRPLRSLRQ